MRSCHPYRHQSRDEHLTMMEVTRATQMASWMKKTKKSLSTERVMQNRKSYGKAQSASSVTRRQIPISLLNRYHHIAQIVQNKLIMSRQQHEGNHRLLNHGSL